MLSRGIPWNMPLVTCIFFVYTRALRLVCIRKIGTVILKKKFAMRMHRRFHEAEIVVVPCKRAQHCCATLRRSQNNRSFGTCCAKSLTGFKLHATSANIVEVPCKRTQHVGPNSVGSFAPCSYNNQHARHCCWLSVFNDSFGLGSSKAD